MNVSNVGQVNLMNDSTINRTVTIPKGQREDSVSMRMGATTMPLAASGTGQIELLDANNNIIGSYTKNLVQNISGDRTKSNMAADQNATSNVIKITSGHPG